ncbi:MAG: CocE/NonD family hydrolase [Acidobacteriota bacterium]
MDTKTAALLLALSLPLSSPASGQSATSSFGHYVPSYPKATEYEGYSTFIAAGDGTRLAIDVSLPKSAESEDIGRRPTVLYTSVYGRALQIEGARVPPLSGSIEQLRAIGFDPVRTALLEHGYVVVALDVRGTGASFGPSYGFLDDLKRQSIVETIEWIASQPWSNGKVGTTGHSWEAGASLLPAIGKPPEALGAVFARSPALDIGSLRYGQLARWQAGFVYGLTFEDPEGEAAAIAAPLQGGRPPLMPVVPVGPPEELSAARAEQGSQYARNMASLAAADLFLGLRRCARPAEQQDTLIADYTPLEDRFPALSESKVPIYMVSGANDWLGIEEAVSTALSIPNVLKGTWHPGAHGEEGFDRDDLRNTLSRRILAFESVRWFDQWLRNIDTGILDEPRVHAPILDQSWVEQEPDDVGIDYVAGESFPLSDSTETTFFLHVDKDGRAPIAFPSGLHGEAQEARRTVRLPVDFTPAAGGDEGRPTRTASRAVPRWYGDLSPNDRRGITFDSVELDQDLLAQGAGTLSLTVSLQGKRAMVYAFLEELDVDGRSNYVAEGGLTLEPLTSDSGSCAKGVVHIRDESLVEIPLSIAFHRFNAGSRLRITLLPFNASELARLPEPLGGLDPDASITLCFGSECGGSFRLPILSEETFEAARVKLQ